MFYSEKSGAGKINFPLEIVRSSPSLPWPYRLFVPFSPRRSQEERYHQRRNCRDFNPRRLLRWMAKGLGELPSRQRSLGRRQCARRSQGKRIVLGTSSPSSRIVPKRYTASASPISVLLQKCPTLEWSCLMTNSKL